MVLWLASMLSSHRMSVIESNKALSAPTVQRQRVIQSVRLLRRRRNPRDNKPNPVPALRVYNQNQAIQVEQRVESRVGLLHNPSRLSHKDNLKQHLPSWELQSKQGNPT